MPVVKIDQCKEAYDDIGFDLDLDDSHLCAGSEPGKCSAPGDGGLFSKLSDGRWQVVGVASSGIKYCDDEIGIPVVFTRVSQYTQWIEQTMAKML